MAMARSVVAVPARLASSRLPDKVLADIGGKPMIQRVLEQCAKAAGPASAAALALRRNVRRVTGRWGCVPFIGMMEAPTRYGVGSVCPV